MDNVEKTIHWRQGPEKLEYLPHCLHKIDTDIPKYTKMCFINSVIGKIVKMHAAYKNGLDKHKLLIFMPNFN